jgi:hypothetical protein
MSAETESRPDIAIVRLNEGFVMDYLGYTTAHTNADDLAERVRQVASQGEVGLREPAATPPPPQQVVTPAPHEPVPSPDLRAATAVPSAATLAPATNLSLAQQWANIGKLNAFMAAGFDTQGKMFTREMWDKALPMFAPNVDPKEAEFQLGEFLGSLHDDE